MNNPRARMAVKKYRPSTVEIVLASQYARIGGELYPDKIARWQIAPKWIMRENRYAIIPTLTKRVLVTLSLSFFRLLSGALFRCIFDSSTHPVIFRHNFQV